MLSAEIIAIGTELLTPTKTDTNSLWLTDLLNNSGIEVKLKTIVGDDERRLEETLRDALARSDIVITTGGLGPTEDDITRRVAARSVGKDLIFREDLLEDLRRRFRAFGYEMPERNRQQAFVIDGSEILPNPNGSAVGLLFEEAGRSLVLLPGPPREARPMFEEHVLPRLKELAGGVVVRRRSLMVSGMGESAVDEKIAPIYTEYANPETSILFSRSSIEVQLKATADHPEEAERLLTELADKIADRLGLHCYSSEGEEMEEVVGRLLRSAGQTVSTAESCTGGLIAQRLTEVPGSSAYFMEGFVTYSNEAKTDLLGVSPELIGEFGAVSKEVAEAMAKGALERSKTDYAISVTGIAGPDGGSEEKPVGTVCIGIATQDSVRAILIKLPGDRHLVRWRSSQAALDLLRREILAREEASYANP